jgi:hypothetical protein
MYSRDDEQVRGVVGALALPVPAPVQRVPTTARIAATGSASPSGEGAILKLSSGNTSCQPQNQVPAKSGDGADSDLCVPVQGQGPQGVIATPASASGIPAMTPPPHISAALLVCLSDSCNDLGAPTRWVDAALLVDQTMALLALPVAAQSVTASWQRLWTYAAPKAHSHNQAVSHGLSRTPSACSPPSQTEADTQSSLQVGSLVHFVSMTAEPDYWRCRTYTYKPGADGTLSSCKRRPTGSCGPYNSAKSAIATGRHWCPP